MTSRAPQAPASRQMHRKVLNTFWAVFLISIIAELVAFIIMLNTEPSWIRTFLIDTVLTPTAIHLGVLIVNEVAYKAKLESPVLLIISGTLIAASLIIGNKTIHIQYVFLLSMMVSLYYFSMRHLILAFCVNVGAFGVVYAIYSEIRESISIYEMFAFIFIMIGMFYIIRGVIYRGMSILDDLTRMVKAEQELLVRNVMMDRMVKMDALTDLYNHKTFHEYLELLIEQSENNRLPLQLAVIDIDNFKGINDTFGHAVGDIILKRVADVLRESLSPNEIVARYGGEEFAAIFPGSPLISAYEMLEQVRERIEGLEHEEMDGRKVTVSIGLSEFQQGSKKSMLFAEADALLYVAKRTGKNKTMMPGMNGAE